MHEEIAFSTFSDKKSSALKLLKSFLSSYVQFIQSPSRQDSILKTIQYSLWLLSKFYSSSRTKQGTSHRVVESLLKLQGEISWARYLLRFFGFPIAIDALDVKSSWATGNTSNRVGRVMSWTMMGYHPLEHLSYLFYKAPGIRWLPIVSPTPMQTPGATASCPNPGRYSSAQLASKASAWSCRFWLMWIVLDIVRCSLELRETRQTSEISFESNDGSRHAGSEEDDTEQSQHKEGRCKGPITITTKHMRILRDALYVLPAITWSLPKWDTDPLLSGDQVNGLCWLESMVGLYQVIHDYQKT